jgi:hypothetical protein
MSMRWALAVSALTLVALTGPISAGDKRSAALAVRVTVVRSCSVNTDTATGAGSVSCGTRFGPPVLSASSTITVPLPAPPAARVDTGSIAAIAAAVPAAPAPATTAAAPTDAPLQPESTADADPNDEAETMTPARVPESGPDPTAARDHRRTTVAFRLVTVNF